MPESPIEGYPKLACHMGSCPNSSIFRRFGSLNSKNLLYLQAELVHLEEKLQALEEVDSISPVGNSSDYSGDWYWLENSIDENNGQQLETVLKIREKLKEYNNAVIRQAVLLGFSPPRAHDLQTLRDWIQRPQMGNYPLIGTNRNTWGSLDSLINPQTDLITLATPTHNDIFTHWFFEKLIPLIHRLPWTRAKETDLEAGIVIYRDENIQRYTAFLSTIVASLLPTVAICAVLCAGDEGSVRIDCGIYGGVYGLSGGFYFGEEGGDICGYFGVCGGAGCFYFDAAAVGDVS
ncbi:hypothetical protein HYALB_00006034 [Hymenoscyphus albidus]|uniref:DUF6594 domain-containing protein n=1 Tax=Hymenoscyphus albidus TaxID=595503 RepID=A0A9N9LWZ0_9HELO|nr:hypothetical protein HYALB_00006034 [Hymenoscyphus albidus]